MFTGKRGKIAPAQEFLRFIDPSQSSTKAFKRPTSDLNSVWLAAHLDNPKNSIAAFLDTLELISEPDETTTKLCHDILTGITHEDLVSLMQVNPNLRGFIQGYISELKLRELLVKIGGVEKVEKISDQNEAEKYDYRVMYQGKLLRIEAKSVPTKGVGFDVLNDTWQANVVIQNSGNRLVKLCSLNEDGSEQSVRTKALVKGHFDILAVSLFPITRQWDFAFVDARYLREDPNLPGFLSRKLDLNPAYTPSYTKDIKKLMDRLISC